MHKFPNPAKMKIITGCFYDSYFRGIQIQKIAWYFDRKPAPLIILATLKSWLQLTVKERKSMAFYIIVFHFRVLQFVAMNQKEVIERAEFLTTFSNLRGVDGRKMVKTELRFNKEVISSEWMDDINRLILSVLESEHLGQMTLSGLQVLIFH